MWNVSMYGVSLKLCMCMGPYQSDIHAVIVATRCKAHEIVHAVQGLLNRSVVFLWELIV